MAQAFPDVEGPEALDGKKFHELVAQTLTLRKLNPRDVEGFICSDEQYDAATMVCEDVWSGHAFAPRGDLSIETRVAAPHRVHAQSFGTVDAYLYNALTRELWIWDFKYGYGLVEVFQNWQLINYAAAILDELEVDGLEDQTITIHFRIIQPRAFHRDGPIREWTVRASDLRADFNILKMNATKAMESDATTQSGAHCRYCPARHACRTALDAGMQLYELANKTTPLDLSPEALGVQYAIVKRAHEQLEYLESGLSEEIKSRLRGGARVPGFHMEPGRGRESWERPIKEIRLLGELMGVELGKDEVITPFQARKLGIDPAILDRYVSIPKRGNRLVADDGSQAKRIFATVGATMP